MTDPKQAAAGIVRACNHFHTEAELIDAVNVWTRQMRDRDQFERLVDHLAIALMMLAAEQPEELIDQLADALQQGVPT